MKYIDVYKGGLVYTHIHYPAAVVLFFYILINKAIATTATTKKGGKHYYNTIWKLNGLIYQHSQQMTHRLIGSQKKERELINNEQ